MTTKYYKTSNKAIIKAAADIVAAKADFYAQCKVVGDMFNGQPNVSK